MQTLRVCSQSDGSQKERERGEDAGGPVVSMAFSNTNNNYCYYWYRRKRLHIYKAYANGNLCPLRELLKTGQLLSRPKSKQSPAHLLAWRSLT